MITVRYTGPEAAILAGTYILHGETRRVTPAQLADAQAHHPDGFVVVDGALVAPPIVVVVQADDRASAVLDQVVATLPPDPPTLPSAPVPARPQPRAAKRRR